ncbi:serine hydrolase domain-containing protein [Streptomyces sp. NPDC007088]|uniref:serine hydrolase domain-containing protein n=1 Tax=Streptomyces sp. NPDC007088 TaxID=3364773 RepID=UPI00368E812D
MTSRLRPPPLPVAVAASVALAVTGLSVAPALAAPAPPSVARHHHGIPAEQARALAGALADLPADDATAALVRVGGREGAWRGSAGVHDLDSRRPALPGARFRAGSATKVLTAAVVLQLADEGRVALNRPARSYLPDLIPARYRHVTVRQLLNHTSGIPAAETTADTLEEAYAHRFDRTTPRAAVASATARDPEFRPGTVQHYLNINYTVLGLLVERVTRHSYEEEVNRRVIRPLGLRDTYLPGADPAIRGPHNHGYQMFPTADGGTEPRDVTVWGQTGSWAAGDLVSTTADLERLMTALFRGRVVRGPALEEMFTLPGGRVRMYGSDDPAAYSAGLSMLRLGGREVWAKTGSRYGYLTGVAATRDLSRTLVYSVNDTDAKGSGMSDRVLALAGAAFGAAG